MIGDIILSKELVKLNIFKAEPPLLPLVGVICGDGYIASASIKPGINNFVFIAREWDRGPSSYVSSDAPWFQALL